MRAGGSGLVPGRQPAVEYADVAQAEEAQQPPRACGPGQAVGVVQDDRRVLVDAGPAQRLLEIDAQRQRMAAAAARLVPGQVLLHVQVHGAGNVTGEELAPAEFMIGQ